MQKTFKETDKIIEIYNQYKPMPRNIELARQFMQSKVRYIFGRTRYAKPICNSVKIDFVVDDFTPAGTLFEGAKVIKLKDVPKDAVVLNCILDGACTDIHNKIIDAGINSVISISDLFYEFPDEFEIPHVMSDTREKFLNNKSRFQNVFDNLSDELSQKVFHDVLCFRLTGQYNFLSDYKFRLNEQYFENFLNLQEGEVFVDCGGFDGGTSDEFIKNYPQFKKIYFFEPDEENFKQAKKKLNNNPKIEFIQKCISAKDEFLHFNSCGDVSAICQYGESNIKATSLDDFIKNSVSFIKMDLEGWELKALEGAKEHIKNDSPKLAISAYHRADDFYTIFEYIKSINPGYKVYLRHYTQGISETVMYFV